MIDVCLDTDVASLIQKSRQPAWVHGHVAGNRIWLTFVTVGELAKWTEIRAWGSRARRGLDQWVADRGILPYDDEVARVGTARRPVTTPWPSPAAERHLDRRLLPPARHPVAHPQREDFGDFAEHDGLRLLRAPEA